MTPTFLKRLAYALLVIIALIWLFSCKSVQVVHVEKIEYVITAKDSAVVNVQTSLHPLPHLPGNNACSMPYLIPQGHADLPIYAPNLRKIKGGVRIQNAGDNANQGMDKATIDHSTTSAPEGVNISQRTATRWAWIGAAFLLVVGVLLWLIRR